MPPLDEDRNEVNIEFDLIVGSNVRNRREQLGLTQVQLAKKCNIDVTKLSRVENGQRALSFREGLELAHALRMRPKRLTSEA